MSPAKGAAKRSNGARGRRSDRRPLIAVGTVAVAILGFALVRSGGGGSAKVKDDNHPGISHVHGLGVNPADGSLIVATHYGAFRSPENGNATRIGDSAQDTMGFTVVGPDRFLGSGHPDPAGARRGLPGRLGLIESDDGGSSWQALSLSGETDFHALAYAHDRVYGWDSGTGRFMVSGDGKTWDARSRLDLFGFAVDPENSEHIVGTAPNGPVDSSDGGRSWTAAGGPRLVAVSWDAKAGLWGADTGGAVWHKAQEGWQRAGALAGQPEAFLAAPDALYAAALEGDVTGIYRSTDDGRTWDLRYRDGYAPEVTLQADTTVAPAIPPVHPTTSTSPVSLGSGVRGRVSAGPTCPVERIDNPCPPRAVSTTLKLLRPDGSTAATTTSDANGDYSMTARAGTYSLGADYPAGIGGCGPVEVVVPAGGFASADVSCDTGIR